MTISERAHPSAPTIEFGGHTFLVEPRADILAHHALLPAPTPVHPTGAPPAAHSLAQFQSPVRSQGDRGSCWAFAGAAALEAAYKRKYGINIVLSTQYVFAMAKVQELAYDKMSAARAHENNSTLWGFQGSSDIIEKMARSAVCLESDAPYLSQSQMVAVQQTIPGGSTITAPNANPSQAVMDAFEFAEALIPGAARSKCIYQVATFGQGGKPKASDIETLISQNHEVVVSIVLDDTADAAGVWQYDANVQGGGHCFLVIGYDRGKQTFLVKNSWGGSFLEVGYGFIENCVLGYHYITDVVDPKRGAAKRAFWMGAWNLDFDGWRGTLIIRRHTDYRDPKDGPTRLGCFVSDADGKTYDVDGHFEDGGQKCVFFIAAKTDRVPPGTETGQRFDVYCFSWDYHFAAGTTLWNNQTLGALMSRSPLPRS